MNFKQFEHIVSPKRMERYMIAAGKRKRKSMQIYNANLNLAKEVFVVDTSYIKAQYARMLVLFQMMGINSKALLKNMDHVKSECKEIEKLMC